MEKKRRRFIGICLVLMVTLTLSIAGFALETVHYRIASNKIAEPVRIVFISDLHNCIYGGSDQSELIDELEKAEPDLVIFGGDVIDHSGGTKNALTIMKEAGRNYRCYYTPGNHEYDRSDCEDFFNDVRSTGVKVLINSYEDLEIRGNKISIFGIKECSSYQLVKFSRKADTSRYNILIAHRPDEIAEYLAKGKGCDFDLVLSGHAHGGQWRLPKVLKQGLYAPDQGLFPKYTCGKKKYKGTVQIISKGLARPLRMIFVPRIINRPEFTVVDIT